MLVEVCANSLESAQNAEKAGADRIELCSELAVGGITPSYGLLKAVSEKISIPVRVLIRPRSGDFTYTVDEFEIMKSNIKLCAEMGFEGVVVGLLQSDLELDEGRLQELASLNQGLQMTFHRAFDWLLNPMSAINTLEKLGVNTILTSGQQPTAVSGLDLLTALHQNTANMTIMPGAGINASNAHLFKTKGFKAIHLSGVQMQRTLTDDPKVPMNSPKLLSDSALPVSNFEILQEVVRSVK
ncbi:MAG: copper homeostasis protein CutC [Maribacter sp.]